MTQKHGVALSKTFPFEDACVSIAQQLNLDSVLTRSNILCFFIVYVIYMFNVVDFK